MPEFLRSQLPEKNRLVRFSKAKRKQGAARSDRHTLLAVNDVGYGCRVDFPADVQPSQFLAGFRVQCKEVALHRSSEYQVARR